MSYDSKMYFELSKIAGFFSEACVDINDGSVIDPSVEHKFKITVTNRRDAKLFKLIPWTFSNQVVYYGNGYDWFQYKNGKLIHVTDTLSMFAFREMIEEWNTLNP